MVRAKFKCEKKIENLSGYQVELKPVTTGSKENQEFYRFTPYGELVVGTINSEAAKQFEVGQEYYIDISKAE